MRYNPAKEARENERLLSRLERTNDSRGEAHRRHCQDLADIAMLLRRKVIDVEHAEILREQSGVKYRQARMRQRRHDRVTPNSTDAKRGAIFMLVTIVFFLILFGKLFF